jgi:transcriptional regulator with XRE-family HTH domain
MNEARELAKRIRDCIGDEPVAAFARRCGFGESLLRKYINLTSPAAPSAKNLARIAEAAGVSLDWLATGRGPKRRTEQPTDMPDLSRSPYARRWEKIIALIEGIEDDAARAAALEELFARAQSAADMAELRQAVRDLTAALHRASNGL